MIDANQVSMTGLRSQRSMKRGFTPTPCLQCVTALFKGGHIAHPIKEDVKKKDFSPPLGEMRVW